MFKATQELNKDWCISVFTDNAGVVAFDEEDAVCFKVETHNHPSALDPYGGAATGIGGVLRDPMGTGLGAKPIANTDVFCFGNPDKKLDEIPKGVLHPRRIMKGVVAGVRDYGNRMGVPTVNGAIYFDDRYMANPLVFCGNVGLIPYDKCFKHPQAGNLIMVVGGRTGRDGIHGATFSSGQMTHEHENIFSHAVQIGNPIVEKKMLDTLLQARDAGLYEAITDCGAGGLSSAVGEMGEKLGAEVDLEKVPLKYAGLSLYGDLDQRGTGADGYRCAARESGGDQQAVCGRGRGGDRDRAVHGRPQADASVRRAGGGAARYGVPARRDMPLFAKGGMEAAGGQRAGDRRQGQLQRRPACNPVIVQCGKQGVGNTPVRS